MLWCGEVLVENSAWRVGVNSFILERSGKCTN